MGSQQVQGSTTTCRPLKQYLEPTWSHWCPKVVPATLRATSHLLEFRSRLGPQTQNLIKLIKMKLVLMLIPAVLNCLNSWEAAKQVHSKKQAATCSLPWLCTLRTADYYHLALINYYIITKLKYVRNIRLAVSMHFAQVKEAQYDYKSYL